MPLPEEITAVWQHANNTGICLASALHELREGPAPFDPPEHLRTPSRAPQAKGKDRLGNALLLLKEAQVSAQRTEAAIAKQIAAIQEQLADCL